MSQKNRLKPWQSQRFCIPEQDRARFVAHMEKILDVYSEHYDELHPLICMDEASKQITSDVELRCPCHPDSRVAKITTTNERRTCCVHLL